MLSIEIFEIAALAVLLMMLAVWAVSLAMRDASIVDRVWGVGFVWISLCCAGFADNLDFRRLLILILVGIWGIRLSLHITLRNRHHGEDYRYVEMRLAHGKNFWWLSLFTVFLLQGLIMLLVSAPVVAVLALPASRAWTTFDALGLFLWGAGLYFEAIGDRQLKAFRANPANRGQVLDTGLWALTRHPNYFGDLLVWSGLYCFALSVPWGMTTIWSPLLMGFFLRYVSGVELLEKRLAASKPGYAAYMEKTPPFVPHLWRLFSTKRSDEERRGH